MKENSIIIKRMVLSWYWNMIGLKRLAFPNHLQTYMIRWTNRQAWRLCPKSVHPADIDYINYDCLYELSFLDLFKPSTWKDGILFVLPRSGPGFTSGAHGLPALGLHLGQRRGCGLAGRLGDPVRLRDGARQSAATRFGVGFGVRYQVDI